MEGHDRIRDVLNSPRFADCTPRQIYATLLDEGMYLCHWRTAYRLLAAHDEVRERRNQLRHPAYAAPELLATDPNQLWRLLSALHHDLQQTTFVIIGDINLWPAPIVARVLLI